MMTGTSCAVLDHGYVKLVESWGSDEGIIEAARQSTQKGFLGWGTDEKPGDEKLLGYMWRHQHSTPFEFAGMTIEVQAPIFVFREWQRHRTQSFSEASARYAPLPDLNYVPTLERFALSGGPSRQSQSLGGKVLDAEAARTFQEILRNHYEDLENTYQLGLEAGVPKELARLVLPVGRYSRMRASANLRNWLGFLKLRLDESAQWEIRQYAIAVGQYVADRFPRVWGLFEADR
jgi:thymidylate synthase (FAD)